MICAIDNLGKGAAGQAVQNANLALGLTETAGLRLRGGASYERHRGARASCVRASRAGIRREGSSTSRSSAPGRTRPAARCSRATACRPRR